MSGWNFAAVYDVVAEQVPDAPALRQGGRSLTWAEMDRRADGVAGRLLAAGLGRQAKVVQYLRNCPEYLESLVASLKAGLVPVNTNYRYGPDELTYLWSDCDAAAVVFHGSFSETIERLRARLPLIRVWLWVDDGTGACPPWAIPYEEAAQSHPGGLRRRWARDGDDLVLQYTGGTTGLPKGVMWRQHDLFLLVGNGSGGRYGEEQDLDYARARITDPGWRHLPAAPLMHGSGLFTSLGVMARGGSVVMLEGRSFDAEELLDTIDREGVQSVGWVGDAFAKPVLSALDAHPGRWNLGSLRSVISGGVMFSEATKQGLLRHAPYLLLADVFGSSEAPMLGRSVSSARGSLGTASFKPHAKLRVLTEDGRDVTAGSGEPGLLAFAGRLPVGYYKDPEKTAQTFREIDGERYSIAGDWATVEADGTVTLLGRGSSCINTGGEKVFPEEVEEALKLHSAVVDAVVVGVPDERFGEVVVGLVQIEEDAGVDAETLIRHVKDHLAGYKAPRHIVVVDCVSRLANGKVDYPAMQAKAVEGAGAALLSTGPGR